MWCTHGPQLAVLGTSAFLHGLGITAWSCEVLMMVLIHPVLNWKVQFDKVTRVSTVRILTLNRRTVRY